MEPTGQITPTANKSKEEAIAVPSSDSKNWRKIILERVLSEPNKFIFIGVFLLYFIGFAIWHFYLASFGVSSMPFLQTEYVSAAICFLFIFLSLSLPPFLLFNILGKNLISSGLINFHKWDETWVSILFVWYFMTSWILLIFLPGSSLSPLGLKLLLSIATIFVIHFFAGIVLFLIGGYAKSLLHGNNAALSARNVRIRHSRFNRIGNPIPWWPIYIGMTLFINLAFNSGISKSFLMLTVAYWLGASDIPEIQLKNIWPKSDFLLRSMICIGLFLFFMLYIRIFSTEQFNKIPKSVGGGKPEDAVFNVREKNIDTVQSMGVPQYTSNGTPNMIYGPVGILLRTENEILFINHQGTTVKNTNDLTVKQIRAELIDGITFLKVKQ